MTEKVTYCRICEPLCGIVATVEEGRVTKMRPDPDHPLSRGFACPKGIAMTEVQNDPDRVLHPLRRNASGDLERVSWETALGEIAARLGRVRKAHGGRSVAWYMGNPGAFSYSHPLWAKGFIDALGSPHFYTASSQDVSNRFAASALLYGSPYLLPIPDLARTDLLFVVGANPLVSHGSVMSAPRVRDQLHAITGRGGRVIVADPRRSETARAFEHLPLRPDSDAWMLLSVLQVIFDEGLEDPDALAAQAVGVATLRRLCAPHPPERTETRTGIPADRLRILARDLAGSGSTAVYGRTGSCLGRRGTLVSFLLDAVSLVTGNLDRAGGSIFGTSPIPFEDLADRVGVATYDSIRSRVGNLPDVLGSLPATVMAKEITTPGDGQIKAMFISAGNPVLSVPNGEELEEAFGELDLLVSLDLYVTETSRHADYVLPATTFLEREDFPLPFVSLFTTPFINMSEAVVEPAGEARQEWEIIEDMSRRAGIVPSSSRLARIAGRAGVRLSPRRLVELLLRTGPKGDLFGLRRGGLNLKKLAQRPHGIVLANELEGGTLPGRVRHEGGRVRLDPPQITSEVARLEATGAPPGDFPLALIGLRELRSHNSWMHNAESLMRGGRKHLARIHPDDADAAGIDEGEVCRISSADGTIEIQATLTDEVMRGTVAVPHGWGHRGGWEAANRAGGANVNVLASSDPGELEPLAGMAFLNGIAVRIDSVPGRSEAPELPAVASA